MKVGVDRGTDGGDSKKTSFDVCPGCFETVIVPFFATFGSTPTVEELEW